MTPARWRQIESLYEAALNLDAAQRGALLASADPESRSLVERMLASGTGDHFLDRPAARTFQTTETVMAQTMFGPYRVTELIGSGGMGSVYCAIDTRLERKVALKIGAAQYSDRFRLEARAISTLNHPNICTLYDVGPDFLVMEFIEGGTLSAELRKGPLEPLVVALYGAQVARALAEAHGRGIVHRDLKPGNIMLTPHGVKVLDFGLASIASEAGITAPNVVLGTPAYMAPEQLTGGAAAPATDLFALGLVLYEMSVGHLPVPGDSLGRLLSHGGKPAVIPPSQKRRGLPARLDSLIARLLEADPGRRFASASEVAAELDKLGDEARAPAVRVPGPRYLIAALVLLAVVASAFGWFFYRDRQRVWVRDKAIPRIGELSQDNPLEAFLIWKKAKAILPEEPRLRQVEESLTRVISIDSQPAGAKVAIQDYATPDQAWLTLGATPLKDVRVPSGFFRWRVSRSGAPDFLAGLETERKMEFTLPDPSSEMVPVPGGEAGDMVDFVGFLTATLPAFDVDRYEVTNARYQEFADQGGYRRREFWKEKFVENGKELSWEQAMERFRDSTGRPGPSTWEGGHFPPGRGDFPVSGVSWYEASAYAAYAHKELPALIQWIEFSPSQWSRFRINRSNFDPKGPVPVGASGGVGPYGTYGTNGNVREWALNSVDDGLRFILGGAWRTQPYQAYDPEALPPFDRSELNGFRTVRNHAALPAEVVAPVKTYSRDFSKAKPVSDEIFRAYQLLYRYDRTPVDARPVDSPESTADWTRERIEIDAGYRNQRLPVYLFLPKNVRPPYQAVVFYPSARVNTMRSSTRPGDMEFIDYVIQSGRALIYPIYEGTYERRADRKPPGAAGSLDRIVDNAKEVMRSVDYLESRPDIDRNRIAYLGVSQGTAEGVIYVTMEPRFKTAVFLDGGFFLRNGDPGQDQVDFAPRLKIPVLMVNGRYDFSFSPARSQEPLFRMLGTPAGLKERVLLDTPHDVSQDRKHLSEAVLGWLDRYLGKVGV